MNDSDFYRTAAMWQELSAKAYKRARDEYAAGYWQTATFYQQQAARDYRHGLEYLTICDDGC